MPPESAQASPPPAAEIVSGTGSRARGESLSAAWQILTHFDSTKLSTHRAFRNAIGVVLPLIAGYALGMPRGGLVVASGALNVSYSDDSGPYSDRARRMLAASVICAIAVFAGAISGQHQTPAIVLATIWAFIAGMANYRLWPTWERTRISERIARMLDAYRDYLHAVLRFDPAATPSIQGLERSRRAARVARSSLEASVDRLSSEPGATGEQMLRLNSILASSHRFIHAVMALDAIISQSPALSGSAPLKKFAAAVETTLVLLSSALRGGRVMSREFPDLREEHRLMAQARTGDNESEARYDAISVEADRITNSVNTMGEQIVQWMRSPEFAALKSM